MNKLLRLTDTDYLELFSTFYIIRYILYDIASPCGNLENIQYSLKTQWEYD